MSKKLILTGLSSNDILNPQTSSLKLSNYQQILKLSALKISQQKTELGYKKR